MTSRDGRIVYTTGIGRISPQSAKKAVQPGDGIVRVRRETGSRGGKTVTAIRGVPVAESALKELAGELKRLCGRGSARPAWTPRLPSEPARLVAQNNSLP